MEDLKTTVIKNTSYVVGFDGTRHVLYKEGEITYRGKPARKRFLEDVASRNFYGTELYEYMRCTQLDVEEQINVFQFSLAEILRKGSKTISANERMCREVHLRDYKGRKDTEIAPMVFP